MKKASAKSSLKKSAKKAAQQACKEGGGKTSSNMGLMTAFHHMQRASAVVSLMKKGSGEDLTDLLDRGVKLYRKVVEDDAGEEVLLQSIGLLRAAEHLSLAGLYEAREKHRQKVASPGLEWLKQLISETGARLKKVEHTERGKGKDLFPAAEELLRQAEDMDHDPHLAFELAMAADALCFALEHGL